MDPYTVISASIYMSLLIFIPGYSITIALFPKREDLGQADRLGMSLIFGFTPAFLLYLLSKNLSIKMTTTTSPLMMVAVTLACILIWAFRTGRIDAGNRPRPIATGEGDPQYGIKLSDEGGG